MANTYTEIHIQIVFAVKNRRSLITKDLKDELYRYMSGIIKKNGHKALQINGMPDHVHILIGMRTHQSLAELVQQIKQGSSYWLNKSKVKAQFQWQEGYSAFSYSKSDVPKVAQYIKNQEDHHSKRSFLEEYMALLEDMNIDYDERYIFKEV